MQFIKMSYQQTIHLIQFNIFLIPYFLYNVIQMHFLINLLKYSTVYY